MTAKPSRFFVAAVVALWLAVVPIVAERGPCALLPCDPAVAYELGPLALAWVRSAVGLALLLAATGAAVALRRHRRV